MLAAGALAGGALVKHPAVMGRTLPTGVEGYMVLSVIGTLGYLVGALAGVGDWALGRPGPPRAARSLCSGTAARLARRASFASRLLPSTARRRRRAGFAAGERRSLSRRARAPGLRFRSARSRSGTTESVGSGSALPQSSGSGRLAPVRASATKRPTGSTVGRNVGKTGAKSGKVQSRGTCPEPVKIPANATVSDATAARLKSWCLRFEAWRLRAGQRCGAAQRRVGRRRAAPRAASSTRSRSTATAED
jgi:hypothetical protein